jgi:CHAT domain-containing protein
LLCGPLFAAADDVRAGEWIESAPGPYTYSVTPTPEGAQLVVLEQVGIDLRIRFADGTIANTPLGRSGPELIYVAAGEASEVAIEPAEAAPGVGRFRLTRVPVDDPRIDQLARALFEAGKSFGSGSDDGQARACDAYRRGSEISGLRAEWLSLARLLAASCFFATGQETSTAALDAVGEQFAFLSVLPHYTHWARAEMLYTALKYDQAVREADVALRAAQGELAAFPERALGIRHDIAEIQALLGGGKTILAFYAGRDDARAGSSEKRRLLDESRDDWAAAIAAAGQLGDAYVLGRAYDFRAAAHFVSGDNAQVIEDLLLAKDQISKTRNPHWLLPVLGSIGDFHKRWGELRAAQEAYLDSLRIVDGNTTNGKYADTYNNAAIFYYDIGDFPRARSYIETAIRLSKQTGREARASAQSRQLALILEKQGDYEAAKALNSNLLAYFRSIDLESNGASWSPYTIMTQAALSRIEHKLGNSETAWRLSAEAISELEARSINVGTDLPAVYINHASILFDRGETKAALEILDRTADQYAREPIELVDLLAAKLTLLQRLGSTQEAISLAARVFDIVESQRAEIDAVRLGPYWSNRTNDIYTAQADYLLRADGDRRAHQALAFEVAEQARAVSLRLRRLEVLVARNSTNDAARGEWLNIVREVQQTRGRQGTEADRLDFERRLGDARERYFATHGVKTSPADLEVESLAEVQRRLPGDTVLLQFVAGPTSVWRFDVTRDGWAVTELGEARIVDALIAAAEYELSNPYVRSEAKTTELSALLLKGLSLDESKKNLLIAPSDGLSAFPFSALLLNGEPVAERATMSLVPSISEYLAGGIERIAAPSPDRLDIAVLADPAFDGPPVPSAAFAGAEEFRTWADSLQRLPASATEANELIRYYPEGRRLLLLGTEATQRNFFDDRVRRARVIHIATHGYFDESMPELIGFAMAKDDSDDDGFVSTAEISAQDFLADLVVISACSTGRGVQIAGEGNMSLARAFLAQGVNAVVSTLWPVSDAATALFMREFYRALNEDGQSLPEALRSAQQVLRNTARFRDPFYWSGYALTLAAMPERQSASADVR